MTVELLNIDCMEYMAELPDKAFGLAIVDPPYGHDAQLGGRPSGARYHSSGKGWNKKPGPEYFQELRRVSSDQVVWGGNYFLSSLGDCRCYLVWKKNMPEKASFAPVELAWTSFDKTPNWFFAQTAGDRGFFSVDGARIHPTQKPLFLYKWLLQNYAEPGQRILDTHLGSASSAIAAHYFGCDFVGCEIDPDYYQSAKERFERETAQQDFFGGAA